MHKLNKKVSKENKVLHLIYTSIFRSTVIRGILYIVLGSSLITVNGYLFKPSAKHRRYPKKNSKSTMPWCFCV